MAVKFQIIDGCGTNRGVKVSATGELAVGPVEYDQSTFHAMAVDDQAYNFFAPLPGHEFIITGMRIKANTGVNPTSDATIIVYEASGPAATATDKILHEEAMVKSDSATIIGIRLRVAQGKWLNGKTDDNTVFMTIFGFYIEAKK